MPKKKNYNSAGFDIRKLLAAGEFSDLEKYFIVSEPLKKPRKKRKSCLRYPFKLLIKLIKTFFLALLALLKGLGGKLRLPKIKIPKIKTKGTDKIAQAFARKNPSSAGVFSLVKGKLPALAFNPRKYGLALTALLTGTALSLTPKIPLSDVTAPISSPLTPPIAPELPTPSPEPTPNPRPAKELPATTPVAPQVPGGTSVGRGIGFNEDQGEILRRELGNIGAQTDSLADGGNVLGKVAASAAIGAGLNRAILGGKLKVPSNLPHLRTAIIGKGLPGAMLVNPKPPSFGGRIWNSIKRPSGGGKTIFKPKRF